MSGHSKWATTKHKKAAIDAKRGKIFTKIIKEITIAARIGGGDPEGNPRLRTAILKAKENNMPADNIKRGIQKGTGELPGTSYEDISYECYGPGGVALIIQVTTDNKNRTVADVRHILTKHGGSMGENGCVAWMFTRKGYFVIDKSVIGEDKLLNLVLDAGAEDLSSEDVNYEVFSEPENFEAVHSALEKNNVPTVMAEVTMVPNSYVSLEGKHAEQMLKLMDALDDNEDVNQVYANFDIADDIMEKFS